VCPNPLQRGALTAVQWITGSRAGHRYSAFVTFDDAVAWVERETQRRYPSLPKLYEQLDAELRKRPRIAVSCV
jgi:hypothetical protein